MLLAFLMAYDLQFIDDCYTTSSIVNYDVKNSELNIELAQSNNKKCGVFPLAVQITATFKVGTERVLFKKIFYDFNYETSKSLQIQCNYDDKTICNKITGTSICIVRIESIIDYTEFSAGAVIIKANDLDVCIENNQLVVVERNALILTAISSGKCQLSDFTYISAEGTLTSLSGTIREFENTDASIDIEEDTFYIRFDVADAVNENFKDRIEKMSVIINVRQSNGMQAQLTFLSANIAYSDFTTIGTDLYCFLEFDTMLFTFTPDLSKIAVYNTSTAEFIVQSVIFDQKTGSMYIIQSETTFSTIETGSVSEYCPALKTSEQENACLSILDSILKNPMNYNSQEEILVLEDGVAVYGAQEYIPGTDSFEISCYSDIQINLYKRSVVVTFSKNEYSELCENRTLKTFEFGGFENMDYEDIELVRKFEAYQIVSPLEIEDVTSAQIAALSKNEEVGLTIDFADGKYDKCITTHSRVFRSDNTAFYREGYIVIAVTCVLGIALAVAEIFINILCKNRRQKKRVMKELDEDGL